MKKGTAHQQADHFDVKPGTLLESLCQHINADIALAHIGKAQAQHEANGVKMPLQFLHHDGPLAEGIACNHLHHNDSDQHGPQHRGKFAHQREQTINAARQRGSWQHQARRPGEGG